MELGDRLGDRLARAGPRCVHRLAVLTRFWKVSCPAGLWYVMLKRLERSPWLMAVCTGLSHMEGVQAQAGLPHPFWASPGEVPPVGWSTLGRGFPCSLETRTGGAPCVQTRPEPSRWPRSPACS